jgi:hypothetical protein
MLVTAPLAHEKLARARSWLAGLGCEVAFASESDDLRGEFSPPARGDLVNPASGATIERVGFAVDGAGELHLCEPACVRKLPARSWSLVRSLGEWCAEIQIVLDKQYAEAQAACDELLGRGFDAEVNPQTLEACVQLDIEGVGRAHLVCVGGRVEGRWLDDLAGHTRSLDAFACPLSEAGDPIDLELRITHLVKREPGRVEDPAPAERPTSAPPPTGVALGAVLEAFGPRAILCTGAFLFRETLWRGRTARFSAQLLPDGRLSASLATPEGVVWSGEVELGAVASLERLVARIERQLARAPQPLQAAQGERAWGAREEELARGLLPPVANETWVLQVRVEQDDGREVRYRGVNVGGEEYGAPRVLPKDFFESAFLAAGASYRMLIRVQDVSASEVTYQRLDAQRRAIGKPRSCPLIVFLASFMPEAAAY